jgi:hypothetical protein
MANVFDGTQVGWSVELYDYVNIGNWLRDNHDNIVFKIIQIIDGRPTDQYFLSNYDNLERDLSKIFFGCNEQTRVLLDKTYIKLSNIGLEHFLLEYNDNLWYFFYPDDNADINSEYSFGDKSQNTRQINSKRCYYLKTNNTSVSISTRRPINVGTEEYANYLRNILPQINCSEIDSTYLLITDVENGIYKNNLDEPDDSGNDSDNETVISSVTPESFELFPKPSPENSSRFSEDSDEENYDERNYRRGGTTYKRKNTFKKKTKTTKSKNKTKQIKKMKRNKSRKNQVTRKTIKNRKNHTKK